MTLFLGPSGLSATSSRCLLPDRRPALGAAVGGCSEIVSTIATTSCLAAAQSVAKRHRPCNGKDGQDAGRDPVSKNDPMVLSSPTAFDCLAEFIFMDRQADFVT